MSSTEALQVFKAMTTALDELDFEKFFGMLSDDIEGYFPYLPEPYPKRSSGIEDFKAVFALASSLFTEFHWTSLEIFSIEQDPNVVVARASSEATLHNGDGYTNDYVFFIRAVDGKVAEYREYFDLARLLTAVATLQS